jgi:hypothetical protein
MALLLKVSSHSPCHARAPGIAASIQRLARAAPAGIRARRDICGAARCNLGRCRRRAPTTGSDLAGYFGHEAHLTLFDVAKYTDGNNE